MDSYDPKSKAIAALFTPQTLVVMLVAFLVIAVAAFIFTSSATELPFDAKSIFEFSVDSITGVPKSLSGFKGKKAYLLVNVASKWGLTKKNYAELQQLYSQYSKKGLEILAFPCNNFGGQGENMHMHMHTYNYTHAYVWGTHCSAQLLSPSHPNLFIPYFPHPLTPSPLEPGTNDEVKAFAERRGATFPLLGKIECENKAITHPLFRYLKTHTPNTGAAGMLGKGLKWNFAKFLCNAKGVPVSRYMPQNSPLSIEKDILALLDL
jgi:glutathione peroxidase